MKFAFSILLILGLGFLAHLFLPWWIMAIIGFVVGAALVLRPTFSHFLAGFIGAFLLWGGMAFYLNLQNEGLLAGKMGQLFGNIPAGGMVLITAVIGGLVAGLAAWAGSLTRLWLTGPRKSGV